MKEGRCSVCGRYSSLDVHHLINGSAKRKKSDEYGLVIEVCRACHRDIHDHPAKYLWLKQKAQEKVMTEQGWSVEDFIREFGKSYL